MKQLLFLNISSTPSLKNIAQISNHSLWPNQLIFTVFRIFTLTTPRSGSLWLGVGGFLNFHSSSPSWCCSQASSPQLMVGWFVVTLILLECYTMV